MGPYFAAHPQNLLSLLKNYTTILTMSLIGLKIDTSFVLTNQLVDLKELTISMLSTISKPLCHCNTFVL